MVLIGFVYMDKYEYKTYIMGANLNYEFNKNIINAFINS